MDLATPRHRVPIGKLEIGMLQGMVAALAAAWVFLMLLSAVRSDGIERLDNRILLSLREEGNPGVPLGPVWLQDTMLEISALGSRGVLVLGISLSVGFLLIRRSHGALLLLLAAASGGGWLSVTLKQAIARERPSIVPHLAEVLDHSFPSGHSTLASAVYLTVGVLLARTTPDRRFKTYFIGAAVLLSVLVGVSRVYLGVHYPSDVLAGWSAGTAWALLCWMVAVGLQGRGVVARAE